MRNRSVSFGIPLASMNQHSLLCWASHECLIAHAQFKVTPLLSFHLYLSEKHRFEEVRPCTLVATQVSKLHGSLCVITLHSLWRLHYISILVCFPKHLRSVARATSRCMKLGFDCTRQFNCLAKFHDYSYRD